MMSFCCSTLEYLIQRLQMIFLVIFLEIWGWKDLSGKVTVSFFLFLLLCVSCHVNWIASSAVSNWLRWWRRVLWLSPSATLHTPDACFLHRGSVSSLWRRPVSCRRRRSQTRKQLITARHKIQGTLRMGGFLLLFTGAVMCTFYCFWWCLD